MPYIYETGTYKTFLLQVRHVTGCDHCVINISLKLEYTKTHNYFVEVTFDRILLIHE